VLAQLLEQSTSTKYAYLCHPCVQHVSKLKREGVFPSCPCTKLPELTDLSGGFCGYRNIQMIFSYIIHTKFKGHEYLRDDLPSIFQIQEWIETAWDRGINAQGRLETGGIRGTRKYIGTPEVCSSSIALCTVQDEWLIFVHQALAVLRLLEIPYATQAIKHPEPGKSEELLMEFVENHFQSGVEDPTERIRKTNLPPLYFQHNGISPHPGPNSQTLPFHTDN
jgi:hypothetical protein